MHDLSGFVQTSTVERAYLSAVEQQDDQSRGVETQPCSKTRDRKRKHTISEERRAAARRNNLAISCMNLLARIERDIG